MGTFNAKREQDLLDRKRQIDAERRAQAVLRRKARAQQTATVMATIAHASVRAS